MVLPLFSGRFATCNAAQIIAPLETPTGKYLGMAHIQRMLREPPHESVGTVMDRDVEALSTSATLVQVARHLAAYNLVSVPIVDELGRLVGAVTVDDITGLGQTLAAHALCTGIASVRKEHHQQPGAGHYGVFSGRRWRGEVAPRIRDFIRRHDRPLAD